MRNELWKRLAVMGVLVSVAAVPVGENVVNVTVQAAESEEEQLLFDQAVEDAMIIDQDEILPVVSLDKGEPYAVYDQEGRVLLYTFHKYPDSYPDGTEVKLEWGNVWAFTGGELEDWYQKNKDGVTDWQNEN